MKPANPDLQALREGDDTALSRLIARWKQPLFAFAWRYLHNSADAQDLVGKVFVRLYEQRGKLDAETNLSAWLFTILANFCHNQRRWRMRHATLSLDAPDGTSESDRTLADTVPLDEPAPDRLLERAEALDALTAAIDRMPHDLKVALLLHHYEHLSYAEIGQITGCSERGVETRLYRARQHLRAELTPYLREVAGP